MYYVLIFSLLAIVALSVSVGYLLQKRRAMRRIFDGLEMRLFLVSIRQETKKEQPDIKREINYTEQLFLSLSAFNRPFVLEAAVHHVGEAINFYVAVDRSVADAAVKQMQGIWADAQISPSDEYNPFNSAGESLGAYITQKENFVLPIRTYAEIESDTFGPIVNGLSKLDEIGEGAAIQLIVKPAGKQFKRTLGKYIEFLKKGERLEDILSVSFLKTAGKGLKSGFDSEKTQAKKERERDKVTDDTAIKAIEMKASKPLFKANARVVTSAKTRMQAEYLLSGITTGFSQFGAPMRNQFEIHVPKKPQKLFSQFSFREFDEGQVMILNSEELVSFFHMPISTTDIPRISWLKAKEAPPPVNMPKTGLLLGESVFRGEETPVFLMDEDRRRHFYIIGQTGTGKSTLIYNMAIEDIVKGHGVAVIDPNGDLIQNLMASIPEERIDDVIIFDPGDVERPIGLNMLEFDKSRPEQKTFIVNEMQSIFNRLFPPETMGPMFEQYMRNALLLLMEDAENEPATLMEVPRIFTDTDYRERRLDRILNPAVVDFWRNEAVKAGGDAALANMAPYITSKFNNFIANDYVRPIISQQKSAFNFREVMDNGKILLVNLSKGRIGDINAGLLGMIIVGKIQMSAFSRADVMDQSKRRDFYLYIDEFQNFTTDSVATVLAEARKYRLNLIVAHQYITQLTEKIRDAVFGNVGSMAVFRIGANDADFLVKQFEPVFTQNDLVNIDNLNAYVKLLINGETAKAFNMRIRPSYSNNFELAEKLRELNRVKFGMDRHDIEEEVYRRLRE